MYDIEGRPVFSNDLFNRIVGSAPAIGQADSPLAALLARARAGESVTGAEVELAGQDSSARARVSALPIRDGGRVVGVAVVAVDPSAEASQRETMGIVGHDLRNPLAAIRMTAQLLGKPDEMTAERRLVLSKRILTSSVRMDSIVRSLLDYARAKAGALVRLEREEVDLVPLATRVIEEQTSSVNGRSIELETRGDVRGQWDPGRLEQILGHLASNALRHGPEGVSRLVLDGTSPDGVRITMQNGGPPIPAELLPRLFDPFQVGPRPADTPRRSIGLGLFVVKELTRAHDGTVAVDSTEQTGTRVTVSLPRNAVTAT
jgi:signal transduction histidine kinase